MSPVNPDGPWSSPRHHQRYPVDLLVRIRSLEPRLVDRAFNISDGGIAIKTADPLGPSSVVTFGVQLPHTLELVNVTGEVVWTDGAQMGVRFDWLDPRVAEFVDQLARECERI